MLCTRNYIITLCYLYTVYDLLVEQQYGFRFQHSTEFASVQLVDYIITEMDNNYFVKTPAAIYIDLSKAFDNLRYEILLDKLKY